MKMIITHIKIKVLYVLSAFIVATYVLTACSVNKAFEVTDAEVNVMSSRGYLTDINELKKGYKMYVTRCGSCHHLIEPSKYNIAEWQTYLFTEFQKAKVENGEEKKFISYFIFSKTK